MARLFPLILSAALAGVLASPAGAADDAHGARLPGAVPVNLLPEKAEALRQKVLVQCGLVASKDSLPWYFHFEFGRALLDAGDARRAVMQLTQSVDLNPVPRADKRLYGMWFTDYLPYFQLAEAHAKLDNWPCAAHAMQLSQSSGEAGMGRIDPQRVRALQDAIASKNAALGACNLRDLRNVPFADGTAHG